MHHILQPWLSCMPTVILNLIRSHSRFWIVCLFFGIANFCIATKIRGNGATNRNQVDAIRFSSIYFCYRYCYCRCNSCVRWNIRKLCGCSTIHALHCIRFGNLLCLPSVLFDFFSLRSFFSRCFVRLLFVAILHTHTSTRVLKLFFEFASQIHAIAFD